MLTKENHAYASCETCLFYLEIQGAVPEHGTCHRHAPFPRPENLDKNNNPVEINPNPYFIWPKVDGYDICGEYTADEAKTQE